MARITLRSAVVLGAAGTAGSAAGSMVETLGQPVGAGPVVAGLVALWVAEKLDRLIAGEEDGS
ncbi:hypothetical protein ACWDRX_23830 [Streptomyces nigra]|uniref:hypothetical protein n=1 Tax=Streptomyces TaxID=1883 RepID=UPI000D527CAA|nr:MULTISPECIES: hypothetical protein [Streptomyces]AWE49387.1 hypothetical protein DC008_06455 [Streptomyces nigra]MCF2536658.1 hypothetical protein [Streptomyces sp. FB2]